MKETNTVRIILECKASFPKSVPVNYYYPVFIKLHKHLLRLTAARETNASHSHDEFDVSEEFPRGRQVRRLWWRRRRRNEGHKGLRIWRPQCKQAANPWHEPLAWPRWRSLPNALVLLAQQSALLRWQRRWICRCAALFAFYIMMIPLLHPHSR